MKITAWRIVKEKHAKNAFRGDGSRVYGGRWNPVGIPIVYTADSISLAVLEIIVHLENLSFLFNSFVKVPVFFDSKLVGELNRNKLPIGWNSFPSPVSTQQIGRAWVSSESSAVLKVHSSVIHEEYNFLINPNHPDFSLIKIGAAQKFFFDSRLK